MRNDCNLKTVLSKIFIFDIAHQSPAIDKTHSGNLSKEITFFQNRPLLMITLQEVR